MQDTPAPEGGATSVRPPVPSLSPLVTLVLHEEIAPALGETFDRLAEGVLALSEQFTRRLAETAPSYLDDRALSQAYLAYYLPVNAAKVQALLDEMPDIDCAKKAPGDPIRILELGSGPGTALLPLLEWYAAASWRTNHPLEVVSVDRSAAALATSERLSDRLIRALEISTVTTRRVRADLERLTPESYCRQGHMGGPYDVIILANCLGELFRTARDPIARKTAFVQRWLGVLAETGTFMILEPALRPVTRALHQVRDGLLRDGVCMVYSPCLHDQRCPALVKDDDWCHEERVWTPPDWIPPIDRRVGFIKDTLKFSYLLLRKDGRTIVPRGPAVFRLVSELRDMKGEIRVWACNETGRPEVGRQDRLKRESNAAMDDCRRGDIVEMEALIGKPAKPGMTRLLRIPAEGSVRVLRQV
ncbi:MAG: hypothetical protein E8D45_05725 [Nitrospira sp.]|nr:MAG: hypothetical protein E8D45_05725 [Nitrospira sp.]